LSRAEPRPGGNNDNLIASAAPITNAAGTTYADLERELSNVGTEANYRFPLDVVGPWLIVLARQVT
jgi:hypothetical protein